MKLRPLHDNVLVKRTEEEETSSGGIILSGSAKEKPSQGEVVAVGPGKLTKSGDSTSMNVSVGDTVIFGQYGGNEIKLNGEEYLIISEGDIFDLVKTALCMNNAYKWTRNAAKSGKRFLFVGTKKQASDVVAQEATRCGAAYVNQRWLGGMLTNWTTMKSKDWKIERSRKNGK